MQPEDKNSEASGEQARYSTRRVLAELSLGALATVMFLLIWGLQSCEPPDDASFCNASELLSYYLDIGGGALLLAGVVLVFVYTAIDQVLKNLLPQNND